MYQNIKLKMGIFTLHLVSLNWLYFLLQNWREMSHPAVHLILFGVIVSIDGVYVSVLNQADDVSYSAHVGGAVVGLLLGVIVLKNLNETQKETIFWHVCCITLGISMLSLVLLDICLPIGEKKSDTTEMPFL